MLRTIQLRLLINITIIGLVLGPGPILVSHAETIDYVYDDLNRLIGAYYSDGTVVDYTYDEVGNRLEKRTLAGFPYTITTNFPNLCVTVDGTDYAAPQAFGWTAGSSHTISVTSPQSGGARIVCTYSSWSDAGAQSHTITVPSSSYTYTANFSAQYSLTTSANPLAGGTVNPSGGWYNDRQNVGITANPSQGYSFSQWTGDLSGSTNPNSIIMSGPKSVTANFSQNQYTLTTSVYPSLDYGTIKKHPDKPTYVFGDQVTLTAEANTGYSFGNWSGNTSGTTNLTTVTVSSNMSVTASFASCSNPPFKVGTQYYNDLQSAYSAAGGGDTVQCRGVKFTGNLTAANANSGVKLQGGYDCGYSTYSGNMTFLQGTITIGSSAGPITIGNFILE